MRQKVAKHYKSCMMCEIPEHCRPNRELTRTGKRAAALKAFKEQGKTVYQDVKNPTKKIIKYKGDSPRLVYRQMKKAHSR